MKKSLGLLGIFVLAVSAEAAIAQRADANDSDLIETVLVLGTKQAYRGQFERLETPQMNLEIDEALLRQSGAQDLNQALDLSASVARQNNFGGLWNSPSNFLVNGFNAGRGFGGSRDISGIESVEVLKGPRAALFGRGEPGGTVNLVTKRPTFDEAGSIRIAASRFDSVRTDVDYETPLSNSVAVRLVGFYEDAESFRDTVDTRRMGASPSIAWQISDRSELVYEMEFSDQEVPFDRGIVALDDRLGAVSRSTFLGEPGDGPMKADVLGHQLEYRFSMSDDWSVRLGYNERETELEGLSTEPEL
ncbi:MAG: TonB-dependent receptor plug domain-containing protein, partial [Gammaproteobacteria bacterium]